MPPKKTNQNKLLYLHHVTYCNSKSPRFKELAQKNHIQFTNNPVKAHVILSDQFANLRPLLHKYPKKRFILFTHEPFYSTTRHKSLAKNIHVINCYTGYYTNNYFYFPFSNPPLTPVDPTQLPKVDFNKPRRICILATFHKAMFNKTSEELCQIRNKLGMFGHKLGLTDIYGKGWPAGYVKQNSRDGQWKLSKPQIMQPYFFNICFENSYIRHYVTEKLWDAIRYYNLPIYKGSPWIYDIFPRNSFIDYNDYSSPKELYHAIQNMTYEEWCRRLNACIEVFNHILVTQNPHTVKDQLYHRLIQKINQTKSTSF